MTDSKAPAEDSIQTYEITATIQFRVTGTDMHEAATKASRRLDGVRTNAVVTGVYIHRVDRTEETPADQPDMVTVRADDLIFALDLPGDDYYGPEMHPEMNERLGRLEAALPYCAGRRQWALKGSVVTGDAGVTGICPECLTRQPLDQYGIAFPHRVES